MFLLEHPFLSACPRTQMGLEVLWLSILSRNNYPTIMDLYIIVTQYSSFAEKVNAKVLAKLSQPIIKSNQLNQITWIPKKKKAVES